MGRETSILVTMKENVRSALGGIIDSNKLYQESTEKLSGALDQLDTRHNSLVEQLATTKTALVSAKESMKDAEKAFKEFATPENEQNLKNAAQQVADLTSEVRKNESAIKSNDKAIGDLYDTARKLETSSVSKSIGSGASGDDGSDLLSTLSAMGLTKLAGNLATNAASTLVSSAFGSNTASGIESVLSGIVEGAGLGLATGTGVVGAAIGAAVGGITGVANALLDQYATKDEAFSNLVNQNYSNIVDGSSDFLESGMSIAGNREQYRISFVKLLGGEDIADAYLEDVRKMAVETTYGYDEIVGYTKLLLNSFQPDEILDVLMKLSDVSAGLNWDSSDVQMAIQGFQNMKLEDKVTARYMQYFTQRGLNAYKALADYLGEDESKVYTMVSKGEITGEQGVQALLQFIQTTYGGMSDDLAMTYDAIVDNLSDAEDDLKYAMSSAFEEARKDSLNANIAFYEGEMGASMKEAYAAHGVAEAELLNEQERILREFQEAVISGTEVKGYTEGVNERLQELSEIYAAGEGDNPYLALMEAQQMAANEYLASDAYQEHQQALIDLVTNLKADASLNDAYSSLGLTLAEVLSGKFASGVIAESSRVAQRIASGLSDWDGNSNGNAVSVADAYESGEIANWNQDTHGTNVKAKSHAVGLGYVPYNNYPALLHEGERVLTAVEARAADGAGAAQRINLTINIPMTNGVSMELAEQVAQVIAREVTNAMGTIIK